MHKNYSFGVIYIVVIAFIQRIRAFEDICGTKKGNEKDLRTSGESGPTISRRSAVLVV